MICEVPVVLRSGVLAVLAGAVLLGGCSAAPTPSAPPGVFDSAVGDFGAHFAIGADSGLVSDAPVPRIGAGADGRPAVLVTVPPGGERAEVLPRVPGNQEGQEIWVHYVATFSDVPVTTSTWQLVLQWHQLDDTGSPPLALEVGRGALRLANVGAHQQSLGRVGADDRVDVVLRIRFSRDPRVGTVTAWRSGREVLSGYHPPEGTLSDEGAYLKTGLYRDPAIAQASSVAVSHLAVGPTAASIGVPDGTG